MKIIKIEKNNSDLIVTLDATYTISKIYIDALSNLDNISSTNDLDHTKSFAGSSNSIFTVNIVDLEDAAYVITVKSESAYADYFYVDNTKLYEAKVGLLYSYCSVCLDKQRLHNISLCNFYSQMLQEAIDLNKTQDAIKIYNSFSKILDCTKDVKICCTL